MVLPRTAYEIFDLRELEVTSILMLDDGRSLEHEFKALADVPDYVVTRVRTGTEAVREILDNDFDVIICNMQMPQMSGEMFYRAIERAKPHLCRRFIFISNISTGVRLERFIEQVDGLFLFRPVRISHLSRMVTLAAARGRAF